MEYRRGNMQQGILFYNAETNRYGIKDRIGNIINSGMSCGDCLTIIDPFTLTQTETRIEISGDNEYYLVGTSYKGDLSNIAVII